MSNVGDTLVLPTQAGFLPARFTVAAVDGSGNVTVVSLAYAGQYGTIPANPVHVMGGSSTIKLNLQWLFNTFEQPNVKRFYETQPIGDDSPMVTGRSIVARPDGTSYMGPIDNWNVDGTLPANSVNQMMCQAEHFNSIASLVNGVPKNTMKWNPPLRLQWNGTSWTGFPQYSPNVAPLPNATLPNNGGAVWPKDCYFSWFEDGTAGSSSLKPYFIGLGVPVHDSTDLADGFASAFGSGSQAVVATYRWIKIADAKTWLDSMSLPMVIQGLYVPLKFSIIAPVITLDTFSDAIGSLPYVAVDAVVPPTVPATPTDDPTPSAPAPPSIASAAIFVSDVAGQWVTNYNQFQIGTLKSQFRPDSSSSGNIIQRHGWTLNDGPFIPDYDPNHTYYVFGCSYTRWLFRYIIQYPGVPGWNQIGVSVDGSGLFNCFLVRSYGSSAAAVIQVPKNCAVPDLTFYGQSDILFGRYGVVFEYGNTQVPRGTIPGYQYQPGGPPYINLTDYPAAGDTVIPIIAHNEIELNNATSTTVLGDSGDTIFLASFENALVSLVPVDS